MHGTRFERTRAADRTAAGPAGPSPAATGTEEYVGLRGASANETVNPTMSPPSPHVDERRDDERLPARPGARSSFREVTRP